MHRATFFALKSSLKAALARVRGEVEGNGFVIQAHKQITLSLLCEKHRMSEWLLSYEEMLDAIV